MRLLLLLFVTAVLAAASGRQTDPWLPRELGSFPVRHAGFVELFEDPDFAGGDAADKYTLYITTFNAAQLFVFDPVYRLESPGSWMDFINSWDELLVQVGPDSTAYWPNYPVPVPKSVGGFSGLVQTSGFIPPGKTFGQLEVYNTGTPGQVSGPWNIASGDSRDYSYHWVEWRDVDNDGLVDAMTARFHVGPLGGTESEFLWLKNPGGLGADGTGFENWEQNILVTAGPDVTFQFTSLQAGGVTYDVLVTGELWNENIALYYVEDAPGAWADPANIQSTIIDSAPGQPFEAEFVDLNMDGKIEVIASAFDGSQEDGGHLWLYTQPDDFRDPDWPRTAIASGFRANNYILGNSMTPGKHRIFYPSDDYAAQTNEFGNPVKPWISLSGDDDGKHYVLYPVSEDPDDFTYDTQMIIDTGETTSGTMAIADIDGDGYYEIISAGYTESRVYVHTFKP